MATASHARQVHHIPRQLGRYWQRPGQTCSLYLRHCQESGAGDKVTRVVQACMYAVHCIAIGCRDGPCDNQIHRAMHGGGQCCRLSEPDRSNGRCNLPMIGTRLTFTSNPRGMAQLPQVTVHTCQACIRCTKCEQLSTRTYG